MAWWEIEHTGTEGGGLDVAWTALRCPPDADLSMPSIARFYDYVLGGREHFEVDRRASDAIFKAVPDAVDRPGARWP
ncbi:MAG: SAM-dependent methyltransferase [Pseudonocardia sp.]